MGLSRYTLEANCFFQYSQEPLFRYGFDTIEELKSAIKDAWVYVPKSVIDSAINQWRGRLKMIVDQHGGHIDHLL